MIFALVKVVEMFARRPTVGDDSFAMKAIMSPPRPR